MFKLHQGFLIVDVYMKMPQTLVNVTYNGQDELLDMPDVKQVVSQVENELHQEGGRLLLRKSGTEPLIRVMVESHDLTRNQQLAERVAKVIRSVSEHA